MLRSVLTFSVHYTSLGIRRNSFRLANNWTTYDAKEEMKKSLLHRVKKSIKKSKLNSAHATSTIQNNTLNKEQEEILKPYELNNLNKDETGKQDENFWKSVERAKDKLAGESDVFNYNEARRIETNNRSFNDILTKRLESYLWTCTEVNLINEARATLGFYRRLHNDENVQFKINNPAPYNVVMRGLVKQKSLDKIRRLLKAMVNDGLQPNAETYSIILDYLGQQELTRDVEVTTYSMIKFMDKLNITPEDIFKNIIDPTTINNITNAYRYVDKEFKPPEPFLEQKQDLSLQYCNPILDHLNKDFYTNKFKPNLSITREEMREMCRKQLGVEQQRKIVIKRIDVQIKNSINNNDSIYTEKLKVWEDKWREVLNEKFLSSLKIYEQKFKNARIYDFKVYPCLIVIPPEDYVDIMIQKCYQLVNTFENKSLICENLGQEVYEKYKISYMKKNGHIDRLSDLYYDYCDNYINPNSEDLSNIPRIRIHNLCKKHKIQSLKKLLGPMEWSSYIKKKVGQFLFQLIIDNVHVYIEENGISQQFRAFYEVETPYTATHDTFRIYVYPLLEKYIVRSKDQTFSYLPEHCPMVAPSMPWTSLYVGGNPFSKDYAVRMKASSVVQHKRIIEGGAERIYPFLDSLNQLGSIPFKINEPILDLAIALFKSGEYPEVDLPPHPDRIVYPKIGDSVFRSNDELQQKIQHSKMVRNAFCDWLFMLQKLSMANHFRKNLIWYSFDADFRGRVYPRSEYLNHYQSDVMRALFMFGEGKKLGQTGLDWLKANIMNLSGIKSKQPLKEKILHCDEILDDILDSANDPLGGNKWWMKSEDPFQTLAACMELASALKEDDPTEYISHLAVTQDGSCNGLQHYAALGRDAIGGKLVNLTPSEEKQDVYNEVAKIVEEKRLEDLKKGSGDQYNNAKELEGLITRSLVKRNVMTTVYGVSFYGARNQISQKLKDIGYPQENRRSASYYVADKVFKSLGDVFTRIRVIQDWLNNSARIISKVGGRPVEWITPIGFPVVQNYNTNKVKADIHFSINKDSNIDYLLCPDNSKQRTAFPANYIHSLDATHMMLTSLHCQNAGLFFMSVHDCFWTHACDVPIMNKICREQFVALHSLPLLEDMGKFHREKFGFSGKQVKNDLILNQGSMYRLNKHFEQTLTKGDLNLKGVLNSEFFFS